MADPNELNPNLKVKDLIFAFEHQSQDQEDDFYEEDDYNKPKLKRTKSVGNALSYKLFRKSKIELTDILDIEKEVVKVETHLNYYEIYDKETHVAFQEQLFDILTNIVNIDPEGNSEITQKKKHLIEETQNLARRLNEKLPLESNLRRVAKRVYTVTVKKEEAAVTKDQKHNAKLNYERPISENIGDSVVEDLKNNIIENKAELYQDLNTVGKDMVPATEENVSNEGFILPSVRKLKAFFSFKKSSEKEPFHKIKATNVSRSQSMHWKNKYVTEEKVTTEEFKNDLENIGENMNATEKEESKYLPETQHQERIDFIEPACHLPREEITHSVSVNKLKKMFEEEKQDSSQGLELFSSDQPPRMPEPGIAFTAMNLGAFRLKRSLSGQYMNQVGLLNRNSLTSQSVGNLTNLGRKGSLVINKFGDIENDIDGDDEEEKMPSLDYNNGLPSLGYEVNVPDPIEEDDVKNEPTNIEPHVELYKEKVEFNPTGPPPRMVPEPVVQIYHNEQLNSSRSEADNSHKVKLENKTQELINILESTKSFSVVFSDNSRQETISEELTVDKAEITQNSDIPQKLEFSEVPTLKVQSLVTSFERQISESDHQNVVSIETPKEDIIPAQHSPTSHHIVQSIISSIEMKEQHSSTVIKEEHTVNKEEPLSNGIAVTEIEDTTNINQKSISLNARDTSLDDNPTYLVKYADDNKSKVEEESLNSENKNNITIEGPRNKEPVPENNYGVDHGAKEDPIIVENNNENVELLDVNNIIDNTNQNTEEHTFSSEGHAEVIKKTLIINKSMGDELFEDASLDVEDVDEEFERLLKENV